MAVVQIVLIGILLGGDNAVVISLASRKLPHHQRRRGILYGVLGAAGLRALFTPFVTTLVTIPFVKIAGGILLFWLGLQVVLPDGHEARHELAVRASLGSVLTTILVADIVMSLGNVVAVAAVARDDMGLVAVALLFSIAVVAWCSRRALDTMERAPVITMFGGGLLAYIGGDMMTGDPAIADWLAAHAAWLQHHHVAGVAGALFVATVALVIACMARTTSQVAMEVVSKDERSAS
jgi:YjbE family integral membrane protein